MSSANEKRKLCIVAGNGDLPVQLMRVCKEQERPYCVLGFKNITKPSAFRDAGCPYHEVSLGAGQQILDYLKGNEVQDIVLAGGGFTRPRNILLWPAFILNLKPDRITRESILPRLRDKYKHGDDALLTEIAKIMQEHGYRVIGSQDVAPEIIVKEELLSTRQPEGSDEKDIEEGIKEAKALPPQEGQGVVINHGKILDWEDTGGTDAMIQRVGRVPRKLPSGILVKVARPMQDKRMDLPTIGVTTIENAARAGLRGIVLEAGSSIIVGNRQTIIKKADELGLFIVGVRSEPSV